jgi:DNA-binding beta-propeller fold protein YncE
VARATAGPVAAYPANSSGTVAPTRTLKDPNDPNTFWDPWGVAVGADGEIYVQTFLSDATTFVFAKRATGNDNPVRIFRADGPDNRAIAVDRQGFEYVIGGQASGVIFVEPPGAAGKPHDLYGVNPLRTIQTNETLWYPWPEILATDTQGELFAAIVRPHANAIDVYTGGATGSGVPIRQIQGPSTGLGSCHQGGCAHMSVAWSPLTNHLYVAVTERSGTHVSVFGRDASGDAAPLRTIAGPATGLDGMVITGLAVSPTTGALYVMVKTAGFGGQGKVEVFGRRAQGNAAPMRRFTDPTDHFADAQGIAVG